MIFREDFGCKYGASNGRTGERKVRTHRAGSVAGMHAACAGYYDNQKVMLAPTVS
jgi:hypothetical protein